MLTSKKGSTVGIPHVTDMSSILNAIFFDYEVCSTCMDWAPIKRHSHGPSKNEAQYVLFKWMCVDF